MFGWSRSFRNGDGVREIVAKEYRGYFVEHLQSKARRLNIILGNHEFFALPSLP